MLTKLPFLNFLAIQWTSSPKKCHLYFLKCVYKYSFVSQHSKPQRLHSYHKNTNYLISEPLNKHKPALSQGANGHFSETKSINTKSTKVVFSEIWRSYKQRMVTKILKNNNNIYPLLSGYIRRYKCFRGTLYECWDSEENDPTTDTSD